MMKKFSAHYIITNAGPPLKRGIITVDNDGTVKHVEDTGGKLPETGSVEFYNGVIIPGFVNCHCHLELSYLKGLIPPGTGLAEFIKQIRAQRELLPGEADSAISEADSELQYQGTVLCADICNTDYSFKLKKKSRIKYINLLELFGIDPEKAQKRLNNIRKLSQLAGSMGLTCFLVPHSVYSLSETLFRMLLEETGANRITSVHFMESIEERIFLKSHKGRIYNSYRDSGLLTGTLETVKDHISAVLNEITPSGNLILVHNTYTDKKTIKAIQKRENLFWCLCPGSNIYIENNLPPLDLLIKEKCTIVIGTDSLASNNGLSVLEELKILQKAYPSVPLEELVRWATFNGAVALSETGQFGTIQEGKKPGLLLMQNVDLENMKLLSESNILRLI